MLANVRKVEFPTYGDARGRLIVQEACSDLVPFEIRRSFSSLTRRQGPFAAVTPTTRPARC